MYCHDQRREFRADGINSFGAAAPLAYQQRGWTPANANVEVIARWVMERSRAKKQRQFSKADALEERLLQDHQVQVDDARQEWSFVLPTLSDDTSYYVPSPLGIDDDDDDGLDEATHLIIQQQLHDRCVARHSKQYAQADVIRDALLQQYSVVIDDRTREYKVVTGTMEGEDAFVAQAQASQRSAFARTQKQKQRQEESRSQDAPTRREEEDDEDDESDRILDQEIQSIMQKERQEEEEEIQSSSSRKVMVENAEPNNNNFNNNNNNKDDKDDVAQDEEVELLSTLTVVALKEKLREAGLPLGGRKAELIERLLLQSSISTQL